MTAALGVSLGSAAVAADKPDVAVVGLHQAELTGADQEALAQELVVTINEGGELRGLLPRQVAGTIRGRERPILDDGLVGTARQQLESGIDLYNQAQFEAAAGLLEEAIAGMELGFPGHIDVADLWKAHTYLGNAREQAGQGGLQEQVRIAATLAPYLSLDPALFPPNVVEAYAAALEELKRAPVTLTIHGTEAGEAYVDGVSVGPVPAVARGLGAGVHHVVVRGSDGRVGYERIDLSPPELPSLSPVPDDDPPSEGDDAPDDADPPTIAPPAPQPPRAESVEVEVLAPYLGTAASSSLQRAEQVASLYRALGTRAADVELVLLGGVDAESLHMQLYHSPTDSWSRPIAVPYQGSIADEAVASVGLLLNVVEPDGTLSALSDDTVPLDIRTNAALASLLLAPPTPLPLPDDDDDDRKKPKTGLILGVVAGVVAVAAIGGGIAYVASQQGGDDGTTSPTSPTTTPSTTEPRSSGTIFIEF